MEQRKTAATTRRRTIEWRSIEKNHNPAEHKGGEAWALPPFLFPFSIFSLLLLS
jgi:hypothetical protein